jgi:WD40 repeat protein
MWVMESRQIMVQQHGEESSPHAVLTLFYCYARKDKALRDEIDVHLASLHSSHLITSWHDAMIVPGANWEHEIDIHLNAANIILLLVSPDFLKSDYCYGWEMQRAIERHTKGEAHVIPILLRPSDWEDTPFSTLQMLPTDAKPVTQWTDQDAAFTDIAHGIRHAVNAIIVQKRLQGKEQKQDLQQHTSLVHSSSVQPLIDWGEAPRLGAFYGREKELATLKYFVLDPQCQMVAILGGGGIGKTHLAVKLVTQVKEIFEVVFWRSMLNAPPVKVFLQEIVAYLSRQQYTSISDEIEHQFGILMSCLRERRCLIVLDNMESLLQEGTYCNTFREGYEAYDVLLRRLGTVHHQSCVLITSREKLDVLAHLEGKTAPVRSLRLQGLVLADSLQILEDKGLREDILLSEQLIAAYEGNPLALKLVIQYIIEVFNSSINTFFQESSIIFNDIRDLLDQHFERLSLLEQEIMYWLAIEREAISLRKLQEQMLRPVTLETLHEVCRSLGRRYLIETGVMGVTLQNVILEYMTDRFVACISGEIQAETPRLLESHILMKAHAKEHVRQSQINLIIVVLNRNLLLTNEKGEIEQKCQHILSSLRQNGVAQKTYTSGNILNFLIQSGYNLRGYDFSHLFVCQTYLRGIAIPGINFAYTHFSQAAFTDTFGSIFAVALSTDGALLAAGAANEIRLWDLSGDTVNPLLVCQGHSRWVRCVAFSPDGKLLASGSLDRSLRIWEAKTGQCLHIIKGEDEFWSIAFSPSGRTLASGNSDKTVQIWDVNSGHCLQTLQGHTDEVYSVTFGREGDLLASAGYDRTIHILDTRTGNHIQTQPSHTKEIWSIAFSPNGEVLASGSFDQTIRLWQVSTGQLLQILQGHTDWIYSLTFISDHILASGSSDQTIRIWDIKASSCIQTLAGHTGEIVSLAFNSRRNFLVSGSLDQTIRIWDINTYKCIYSLQGYSHLSNAVAFNLDGSLLASCGLDRAIRLWDIHTEQCIQVLEEPTNWAWSIAFSPNGDLLASGGRDKVIRLWQISTGRCIKRLSEHTDWVMSVAFSPDGILLASGGDDRTLRIWQVSTGQSLTTLHLPQEVFAIAFSPDGSLLASGGYDNVIRLWQVSTMQPLGILQGHTDAIRTVTFSPDGSLLANGSDDRTVRIWRVSTGQSLMILPHSAKITTVAFSPDGNLLGSGDSDGTVYIWQVNTGQCLQILQRHTSKIETIAFHPSENFFVSGSTDGTIQLWQIETGVTLHRLKVDSPYEDINITGISGLTEIQKTILRTLGAIEQ